MDDEESTKQAERVVHKSLIMHAPPDADFSKFFQREPTGHAAQPVVPVFGSSYIKRLLKEHGSSIVGLEEAVAAKDWPLCEMLLKQHGSSIYHDHHQVATERATNAMQKV